MLHAGMFATPAIKASMAAVTEVVSNNDEEKTGGCVLPPCVIMKRGENLEDWGMRLRPNLPTALNALCALADLLKTFHASGYVYYGFKPANVAWYSEEKKWMLIDFACAARKGAPQHSMQAWSMHVRHVLCISPPRNKK